MAKAAAKRKPPRPAPLQRLAEHLIALREVKGWNQSFAADIAKRRKIGVTYQALRWIEEGKNQNPEPALLKALAQLYDTSYEDLLARFISERYGLILAANDLIRQGADQASGLIPGGVDAALFRSVVADRDRLKTSLVDVSKVAADLAQLATRAIETDAPGSAQTGGATGS